MAWNPSPTVAAARDIGKKFNRDQVIILMIDAAGQLELATYGKTMTLCKLTGMLGDTAFDAVLAHMQKLYDQIEDAERQSRHLFCDECKTETPNIDYPAGSDNEHLNKLNPPVTSLPSVSSPPQSGK